MFTIPSILPCVRAIVLLLFHACYSLAAANVLRDPVLRRLDTGATKPSGWLERELKLQAPGLSGQLPYFWSYVNHSMWVGGTSHESPAQFIPYYLNGLVPLSYQVEDDNLNAIRDRYLSYILNQQNISEGCGWLGPDVTLGGNGPREYWSKYLAVEAFESYAEAEPEAKDKVVAALLAHHKQFYKQLSSGAPALNLSRWGFDRSMDGLVGIQWLLDQHYVDLGEEDRALLWALQELLQHETDAVMQSVSDSDGGGYSWKQWFENGDPWAKYNDGEVTGTAHLLRHGVDIGEAMKVGPLLWRMDGSDDSWTNTQVALQWAEKYLHMSDGMYMADEEVQPGSHTASRGTETCSVVETMFSMRTAYEITGNITFMDRLERLAFNSLPAALWPDVTANVYHHCSNQLVTGDSGPYQYNLFFCCSANVHQGWPKFVMSAVQLRDDGRVVISGYAPSTSTLPDGNQVAIEGSYPFADNASITLSQGAAVALRIPCWSEGAVVSIQGELFSEEAKPCTFHNISVSAGATVTVAFKNEIRLHTWQKSDLDGQQLIQGGGTEVHRGPFTFALRPATNVTEAAIDGAPASMKSRAVTATGPWNYALLTSSLKFDGDGANAIPEVPFSATETPPIRIKAQARLVPEWKFGTGARGVAPVPHSPLESTEALEDIELVPFGSTNVRISVFPTLVR